MSIKSTKGVGDGFEGGYFSCLPPSPLRFTFEPRWPPVAVSSEVNTLSPTPGARVFFLIPDLWIHGVSLNDLTEKKGTA